MPIICLFHLIKFIRKGVKYAHILSSNTGNRTEPFTTDTKKGLNTIKSSCKPRSTQGVLLPIYLKPVAMTFYSYS